MCVGWDAATRWTGQIRCYWQCGARLRHNCKSIIWLILPRTNWNMHGACDVTVRGTGTSAGCWIYITFQYWVSSQACFQVGFYWSSGGWVWDRWTFLYYHPFLCMYTPLNYACGKLFLGQPSSLWSLIHFDLDKSSVGDTQDFPSLGESWQPLDAVAFSSSKISQLFFNHVVILMVAPATSKLQILF